MNQPKTADEEFIAEMEWDKSQNIAFKPFRPERIAEQKLQKHKEAIAELIAGLNKIDARPTKHEFLKLKEKYDKEQK